MLLIGRGLCNFEHDNKTDFSSVKKGDMINMPGLMLRDIENPWQIVILSSFAQIDPA